METIALIKGGDNLQVGQVSVQLGLDMNSFKTGIADALRSTQNLERESKSSFSRIGDAMKSGFGFAAGMAGFNGIADGFKAIIGTSMDFESQMSKVKALAGSTDADFQKLRQSAIDLGASSVFSASQAADGMQNLAAAGFNTNQILDAMPGVLNTAAAAGEDFASVSDIMISTMNDFGMKAKDMSHIGDVMAAAANASSISIADMGVSMKYVGPAANSVGMSLESVSSALAELGNSGIKADTAGTSLREGLIRLASPPKEAANELKALGIQVTDSQGKFLPFSSIIGELHTKFEGLTQAQKIQASSQIFGAQSMSAWMTLIEKGKAPLDDLTKQFQNSAGSAKKMADVMNDNLKGSFEQLKGALESTFINIGYKLTPYLKPMVDGMTDFVTGMKDFKIPTGVQESVTSFGKVIKDTFTFIATHLKEVAAFAAAFATFKTLTTVVSAFNLLREALQGVTIAQAALNLVMELNPFVAIGTVIVGLGVLIYTHWDQIKTYLSQTWNTISTTCTDVWNSIYSFFANLWSSEIAIVTNTWNSITSFITNTWNGIKNLSSTIWDGVKNAVVGAFQWMYDHNYFFKDLVDTITKAWDTIKTTSEAVWNAIKTALGTLWGAIKQTATDNFNSTKDVVASIWNAVSGETSRIWTAISTRLSGLWTNIKTDATVKWNEIYSFISGVWQKITEGFDSLVSSAFNWGKNLMNEFISGFESMASKLWDAVTNAAKTVSNFLGFHSPAKMGPGADADKWSPNLVKMYSKGITDNLPMLQNAVNGMALTVNGLSPSGSTTNHYGGNSAYNIYVQPGTPSSQADALMKELRKRGVRLPS